MATVQMESRLQEEGERFRIVFMALESILHVFWDDFEELLKVAQQAMPLIPEQAGNAVIEAAKRDLAINRMLANEISIRNVPDDTGDFLDYASSWIEMASEDWMKVIEEYCDDIKESTADLHREMRDYV